MIHRFRNNNKKCNTLRFRKLCFGYQTGVYSYFSIGCNERFLRQRRQQATSSLGKKQTYITTLLIRVPGTTAQGHQYIPLTFRNFSEDYYSSGREGVSSSPILTLSLHLYHCVGLATPLQRVRFAALSGLPCNHKSMSMPTSSSVSRLSGTLQSGEERSFFLCMCVCVRDTLLILLLSAQGAISARAMEAE